MYDGQVDTLTRVNVYDNLHNVVIGYSTRYNVNIGFASDRSMFDLGYIYFKKLY